MAKIFNSTLSRVGVKSLPETFDMDFINHISSYLNINLKHKEQDWDSFAAEVHDEFDSMFGNEFVTKHITKLKTW